MASGYCNGQYRSRMHVEIAGEVNKCDFHALNPTSFSCCSVLTYSRVQFKSHFLDEIFADHSNTHGYLSCLNPKHNFYN